MKISQILVEYANKCTVHGLHSKEAAAYYDRCAGSDYFCKMAPAIRWLVSTSEQARKDHKAAMVRRERIWRRCKWIAIRVLLFAAGFGLGYCYF